eukprot:433176_1
MSQKLDLEIQQNYTTFKGGEKLITDDLRELGLDDHADHMKIEFDNEKTVKYGLCFLCLCSLATCIWPFFVLCFPCIRYNCKKSAESRLAAVTERQLVLKQGCYGGCCCCWNERTKSVPLNKITDLQKQQGCLQRYFNIEEIRVETASAKPDSGPEMQLIGLKGAHEIRTMILKVRDGQSINNIIPNKAASSGYNPLLPDDNNRSYNKQVEEAITSQHETLVQIKDVLQEMKSALVSMDTKIEKGT